MVILETDWAYIAGMIDGEGHLTIFRHYKKQGIRISSRGYDLEPRLHIANMNLKNLEYIKNKINLGHIQKLKIKREDGVMVSYELRFNPSEIILIIPNILPYLSQKKSRAMILYKFLSFRAKGSMRTRLNQKLKPLIEQYYLDLEEEMAKATLEEKPWLVDTKLRCGKQKL